MTDKSPTGEAIRAGEARYFTNIDGFKDDTAYVRVDSDGRCFGQPRIGEAWLYTATSLEKCKEKVTRGIWRELSAIEAHRMTDPVRAGDAMNLELHRCKVCGTRWLLWPDAMNGGGWNLLDKYSKPGACCDNAAMGEQIEHLRDLPLQVTPATPSDGTPGSAPPSPLREAHDCLLWGQQHPEDAGAMITRALALMATYPQILNHHTEVWQCENCHRQAAVKVTTCGTCHGEMRCRLASPERDTRLLKEAFDCIVSLRARVHAEHLTMRAAGTSSDDCYVCGYGIQETVKKLAAAVLTYVLASPRASAAPIEFCDFADTDGPCSRDAGHNGPHLSSPSPAPPSKEKA